MKNRFQKWQEFSQRIWRILTFACALLAIAGAFEAARLGAPVWIQVLFGAFGGVLLILLLFRR